MSPVGCLLTSCTLVFAMWLDEDEWCRICVIRFPAVSSFNLVINHVCEIITIFSLFFNNFYFVSIYCYYLILLLFY